MNDTIGNPEWGDQEAERKRLKPKEIDVFGVPVEKGSPLENVYSYFTIEDLGELKAIFELSGYSLNVINQLDTAEKWETHSKTLKDFEQSFRAYKAEKAKINPNNGAEKIALRKRFEPTIRSFVQKIEQIPS